MKSALVRPFPWVHYDCLDYWGHRPLHLTQSARQFEKELSLTYLHRLQKTRLGHLPRGLNTPANRLDWSAKKYLHQQTRLTTKSAWICF